MPVLPCVGISGHIPKFSPVRRDFAALRRDFGRVAPIFWPRAPTLASPLHIFAARALPPCDFRPRRRARAFPPPELSFPPGIREQKSLKKADLTQK